MNEDQNCNECHKCCLTLNLGQIRTINQANSSAYNQSFIV